MTPDKFIKITSDFWGAHLKRIQAYNDAGDITSSNDKIILFPNILLISITSEHYIAELLGARKRFTGLTFKRHKEISIDRYLNQFSKEESVPLFHLNGEKHGFINLCLAQEADFEAAKTRFPIIELFPSRLVRSGGKGAVLAFGPKFESSSIENCVFLNRHHNAIRAKHVLEMMIIGKNLTKNKYKDFLHNLSKDKIIKGVHTCASGNESAIILSGQLQNLYLLPKLRETTLGEFLKSHPEIIKDAFSTEKFVYEPYLKWIESAEHNKDEAINPDLLIQRDDGFYDIYDIKTAALNKKSLTKGPRKRRRFIDYVEEGAAQLAHYKEYFSFSKNTEYAKEKYGVEFKNPRYVLVVGSFENADAIEIGEAKRRFDGIDMIDYDTIVLLFLAKYYT